MKDIKKCCRKLSSSNTIKEYDFEFIKNQILTIFEKNGNIRAVKNNNLCYSKTCTYSVQVGTSVDHFSLYRRKRNER